MEKETGQTDKEKPLLDPAVENVGPKDKDPSDISHEDYEPEDDPEVTDNWPAEAERIKKKFMPYHRYIMIGGFTILIFLVVFLGFAYGGMKVCSQLDGILDNKFKCHPGYELDLMYNQEPSLFTDLTFDVQNKSSTS